LNYSTKALAGKIIECLTKAMALSIFSVNDAKRLSEQILKRAVGYQPITDICFNSGSVLVTEVCFLKGEPNARYRKRKYECQGSNPASGLAECFNE
jgi:hypothetical protein